MTVFKIFLIICIGEYYSMGTIFGIIFLAGVILLATQTFKEGAQNASDGSGCGCLFGIIGIVFAIALFSWAGTAPIGMIVAALVVIAIAKGE